MRTSTAERLDWPDAATAITAVTDGLPEVEQVTPEPEPPDLAACLTGPHGLDLVVEVAHAAQPRHQRGQVHRLGVCGDRGVPGRRATPRVLGARHRKRHRRGAVAHAVSARAAPPGRPARALLRLGVGAHHLPQAGTGDGLGIADRNPPAVGHPLLLRSGRPGGPRGRLTLQRAVAPAQHTTPARHMTQAPRMTKAPWRARARTLRMLEVMSTTLELRPPRRARIALAHRAPLGPIDREHVARRALNIVVAALGLIVALPLMLLIAALIKLTSRGPVLFTQTRVGLDRRALSRARANTRRHPDLGGPPFTMYKFPTMRPADETPSAVWAQPEDTRVTPLGPVLPKLRLDELPQLFNVLRGDMNIVGPRPEQPTIFVYLREQIEGYQRRQRVRPGITGWAQINQGYDTSVDDVRRKVLYDLEYIRRQSALEDLRIMARTLPVMLRRRGAW